MGALELMTVGSGIPEMSFTTGSASAVLVLMLAVLAISAFGILRALPARRRVPALRLLHAEGR